VDLLLAHQADSNLAMVPDAEDGEGGFTPLITAAKNGHAAIVRSLLQAGGRKDAVTADGATPLSLAQANEHEAVVELLQSQTLP